MGSVDTIIFELIRVAIGVQGNLAILPTERLWGRLYKLAEKQSLLGVCFSALQKLGADADDGFARIGMSETLYLNWMSMAWVIQQKNESVNEQCRVLHKRITDDGFKSCVLKGQSVAYLYGDLAGLRQSGDIDAWMIGEPEQVIEWARRTGKMFFYDYHHADLSIYNDTEVELHYRPSLSRNLVRNARLQRWFKENGEKHIEFNDILGFAVPDYTFNVILTMNHNFWHLLYEGVGMRQIMDLYFVLRQAPNDSTVREVSILLRHMKLERFASASMWIMKKIFGLDDKYLLFKPDENAGKFLLDEIMQAGNFGKHDERLKDGRYKNRWGLMMTWMRHTFRLFKYYPADVLWTPIGVLRISLWRRWHYRKENELKKI